MTKRDQVRRASAKACLFVSALILALAPAASFDSGRADASTKRARAANIAAQEGGRVDIRLRSLTTRATGRLTVEASEGGGRARLTALNLPDPQTVAAGATTYVVWAVSGGRIVRLGELRRDERGNGGLAFDRPEGLDRYGVIVTAESSADAARPSDPVLTTRADEAAALYPKTDSASNAPTPDEAKSAPTPRVPDLSANAHARHTASGDFYSEVDDALVSNGGGRVIELEGDAATAHASGAARATLRANRAYVRVNFRGVPLPSALGASVYVLWGVLPDGRIVYMGSLPATEDLNRAEVYVRVAGFDSDDYTLFVTAEQQRPAPSPSGRRVLAPKNASLIK